MKLRVDPHHEIVELSHLAVDSGVFVVHRPNEAISQITHDSVEAEEQVALEELAEFSRLRWVIEAVVETRKHLVHPLHILHSRVELCIYKEDS